MKVLVTGGAGFIGSRLCVALADRGHNVSALDNLSPQVHGPDADGAERVRTAGRLIVGDVTDRAALTAALEGQEAVVHLAAETGTGQSMYRINHYTRVNIGGTALLFDLLANAPHSIARVVVASSRAVYGEGRYRAADGSYVYPGPRDEADLAAGDFAPKVPGAGVLEPVATDEESKLHPSSLYGITKQVQEQMVMTLAPPLGIAPVALRYQNVFGPGQSLSNPYTGILSIFSNLILNEKPINIFEDGEESRDFVFIDDVVAATVLAIERPGAAGQVFNIGTGVAVTVNQVVEALGRHLGRTVEASVSGNYRIGDIRHNFADLSRATARLGFAPAWDFDSGIAAFCEWVRRTGPQPSEYDRSLAELRAKGLMK